MKKLKYLVIHCSATPEGREVTSEMIRRWHTSPVSEGGRGWKQVGYSDMIHLDGTIENLVPYNDNQVVEPWEITNGAFGINSQSRHIVYVGGTEKHDINKAKDTRTEAQLKAMESYVKKFVTKHPTAKVAGHNQFAQKACPSFDTIAWCKSIGLIKFNIYFNDPECDG
jgi:N-acetylmuramoyl-L-alanine amidase